MATALTTYRATLGSLLFNCRWSGGVLVDDSGTLTLTNGGTPTTNSGAGLDGQDLATFNGTNQGVDMSAAGGVAFIAAIEAGGVEVGFDVIHSSTANKDKILATYSGAGNNACDIQFNSDSNANYSATGGISVLLKDNAGTGKVFFWDLNTTKLHTSGIISRFHIFISKTTCSLYHNGTLVGTTTGSAATLSTFTSASAGKLVFSGYGFGGSATFDADSFNGSAGNVFARTATLTEAQRRADCAIGNDSVDSTPLAYFYRADTTVYTTALVPATDLIKVITWTAAGTGAGPSLGTAASFDPGTADPVYVDPYYLVAANGNIPAVSCDNNFSSDGAWPSYLTGHRRQALRTSSMTGKTFRCSNCAMYFIGRIPTLQPQGNTNQVIIGLYSGGSLRAGISINNGRVVLLDSNGSTTRDTLTTDVLDCRNGPSLVYIEISINPTGTVTIRMNRWEGTTTVAASVGNHTIDEIRIGGSPESHGGNAAIWLNEVGVFRTASTATERAARATRAFTKYSSGGTGGWGRTGETLNPRNHFIVLADSLWLQYSLHSLGFGMLFPDACVNNTSWLVINVGGLQMVGNPDTDILDKSPEAAAKKDPAATVKGLLVCLGTNDCIDTTNVPHTGRGDTGAELNTDLGTVLATMTGFTWIGVTGMSDNGPTGTQITDYQALINARVGVTINAAFMMPAVFAHTADGIHINEAAYTQLWSNAIWYGNVSGGRGGGLSAAAPEFATPSAGPRTRTRARTRR